MSGEKVRWGIKSEEGLIRSHVSDYATYFDAFYEYTKNLEEAKAKNITIEFLYGKKMMLIYGDSTGMGVKELEEIRTSIGKSVKGASHHGLGILAFMRFAKKMVTVSLKDGKFYILSCYGEDDMIFSDTGVTREVTIEDGAYAEYYRRLNKYDKGSITIIEGVGGYKSDRFDYVFDMKKEFEEKEFIKNLQRKCGFNLHDHNYVLKTDLSDNKKGKKIAPKVGTGKCIDFTVPSASLPAEGIPGTSKDTFVFNDRLCQLKVRFKMHVGLSNDGIIQISQDKQNGLLFNDAVRMKVSNDCVFRSPDYTKYLNGLIDFKITPLEGDEPINVYTGTRSVLAMDSGFGDCLVNILTYADQEIIRPAIEKLEKRSDTRVDDLRSKNLQKYMEMLFRDRKNLVNDLNMAQNTGPVAGSNYVECPKCGLKVPPIRGHKSTETIQYKRNEIYCFEDTPMYRCGGCGNKWAKRVYIRPDTPVGPGTDGQDRKPPIYESPEDGGQDRQRRRGYGYSYIVGPLDHGDDRITSVTATKVVKINRNHVFYRAIENSRSKDVQALYECLMALTAITNHDLADVSRDVYAQRLQAAMAETIEWSATSKHRISGAELEKLHQEDAQKAPIKPPEPIVIRRATPKSMPSIKDSVSALKEKWGLKR